jgi:hypothetical protein
MPRPDASLAARGWLAKGSDDLEAARVFLDNERVAVWIDALQALQPLAVQERYPVLTPCAVTRDELRRLFAHAESILATLRARLGP